MNLAILDADLARAAALEDPSGAAGPTSAEGSSRRKQEGPRIVWSASLDRAPSITFVDIDEYPPEMLARPRVPRLRPATLQRK